MLAFKLQNQKTSGFLEVGGGLGEHGTVSQAEVWSKGPLEQLEASSVPVPKPAGLQGRGGKKFKGWKVPSTHCRNSDKRVLYLTE